MDEIMFIEGLVPEDVIEHIGRSKMDGAKVGSGRYPLGSGENPYHHGRLLGKISEKHMAKRKSRAAAEKRARARAANENEADREERKRAAIQSGNPEEIAPFVTEMSTQEIIDVKNRLQAMLDLNDVMVKRNPSYGRTRAQRALVALERANKNTNTVVDSYNNVARILNAFRGTDLPIIASTKTQQNKKK